MRSERRPAVLGLALLLAGAAPAGLAEELLIERVLAAVNETPVLLSDVRLLAELRSLDEKAALDAAIDERLMFQEAVRLSQTSIGAAEEQAAYDSLKARVQRVRALPAPPAPGAAAQPATNLSEPGLRRLARVEATILRYVEFRFRPQVRVADDAVRAAYEQEVQGQVTPPALEDRAPVLRARLEQQALDQRLEAWIRELRASGDVRLVE